MSLPRSEQGRWLMMIKIDMGKLHVSQAAKYIEVGNPQVSHKEKVQ